MKLIPGHCWKGMINVHLRHQSLEDCSSDETFSNALTATKTRSSSTTPVEREMHYRRHCRHAPTWNAGWKLRTQGVHYQSYLQCLWRHCSLSSLLSSPREDLPSTSLVLTLMTSIDTLRRSAETSRSLGKNASSAAVRMLTSACKPNAS